MLQRLRLEELAKLPGQFGVTYYTWDEKNRCTYYLWDGISYRELQPASGADVLVLRSDTPAQVAEKIRTLLPEVEATSPAGMGRTVRLPPGKIATAPAVLSSMQSMEGAGVGATILELSYTGMVAGQQYGMLTVPGSALDPGYSRSKRGVRGQGLIANLAIDGNRQAIEAAYGSGAGQFPVVDGYVGEEGAKRSHVIDNVTVANCTGDGFNIKQDADQLIGRRMRAEGVRGVGLRISGASDVKLSDIGMTADGGAAVFSNCAPEVDRFDLFTSKTAAPTVATLILDSCIGAMFSKGTIAGRTEIYGKNSNGNIDVRYTNTYHSFIDVKFKHDTDRAAPNSYLLISDADEVALLRAKFIFDRVGTLIADLPAYYIEFRTDDTGEPIKNGYVRASMCGGWMESGRPGGEKLPLMGCRKHWATHPKAVMFDWGVPGQLELVPAWKVNNPDPALRSHVRASSSGTARTVSKADYPFGYLCATLDKGVGGVGIAGTHGMLDDAATSAPIPVEPTASTTDLIWAMRVLP